MTKEEFNEAVEDLELEGHPQTAAQARVFAAAGFIIRHRRGIPDDVAWPGPTYGELAEFLAGMDRRQRKLLKKIAEGLEADEVTKEEKEEELKGGYG